MLIQILVTIGVLLLVFPSIYSSYRKKSMTPLGTMIWIFFWVVGLILIWFPKLIEIVGQTLGVTRSIDALVYVAIVFLLYSMLRQRIRINEINKEITLLNRKLALKDIKEK